MHGASTVDRCLNGIFNHSGYVLSKPPGNLTYILTYIYDTQSQTYIYICDTIYLGRNSTCIHPGTDVKVRFMQLDEGHS